MKSDNPLVSIILPTYNGEKYIKEAIESVLTQTYTNFELIIVNDCSKDRTLEIVQEYSFKDSRIKIISNKENEKLPASLNIGFKEAKGEYLTWTSDDNIYKPQAIEKMAEYLDNNDSCDLISFDNDFINEQNEFIKKLTDAYPNRNTLELIIGCNIGACFMYRKSITEKVGKYDEKMFCSEDYDYWCRIAIAGKIHYINEVYYLYRKNSQSISATKQAIVQKKTLKIRKKYALPILNKYLPNKTDQIKFLIRLYLDEKNRTWFNYAKEINQTKTYLWYFLYKYVFSVNRIKNKTTLRFLGIKHTFK